ncbi:MAG: SGNH/GDSL hydrolase family protein [Bacteroidota bacterium]
MQLKLIAIYTAFVIRLIVCIPVLPFIYWLGKKIKNTVPDLPEACRNVDGQLGMPEKTRKVVLVGESSIAGVGITDHLEGIPGSIGKLLGAKGKGISWQIVAKSGFKAADVLRVLVPRLPDTDADFVILGLGGNDTFQMTPPWQWRIKMKKLVQVLRQQYPGAHLIVSAMPPVADFPVFPWVLQQFMGGQTNLLRLTLQDFPELFARLSYLGEKVRMQEWVAKSNGLTLADFFSDGVHPSSVTYQLIGEAIGTEMLAIEAKSGKESALKRAALEQNQ